MDGEQKEEQRLDSRVAVLENQHTTTGNRLDKVEEKQDRYDSKMTTLLVLVIVALLALVANFITKAL